MTTISHRTPAPPTPGAPPAPSLPPALQDPGPLRARPQFQFLTLDELAREKPRPWLVPDVVARGDLVLVWGDPKSGKTLLATSLAVHAAAGAKWFTARTPAWDRPLRIAYIAAEGAARDRYDQAIAVVRLSQELVDRYDRLREALRFLDRPVNLGEADGLRLLVESARKALGGNSPDLWIIDTLSRCAAGLEENSAAEMSTVVDAITRGLLAPDAHGTRAAVLLIHHGTKDGKHERGSSVFRGAWDREIKVTREGDRVTVSCDSTRTTGFPAFTARIETVPTVDLDTNDDGPILDFDGSPFRTARLVQVVEPVAGAQGARGTRRRPPDEEVDQVGPIVAELVRPHFDGRAPSQNKLLDVVKATRDDHGLRRDRIVACIPGMLERAWLHKGTPGRNGGCEILAGHGPDPHATPTANTNGASLFGECDSPDDPTREDH